MERKGCDNYQKISMDDKWVHATPLLIELPAGAYLSQSIFFRIHFSSTGTYQGPETTS